MALSTFTMSGRHHHNLHYYFFLTPFVAVIKCLKERAQGESNYFGTRFERTAHGGEMVAAEEAGHD